MNQNDLETTETLLADWRRHQAEIDRIRERLRELFGGASAPSLSQPVPASENPKPQQMLTGPSWPLGAVQSGTKGRQILRIIAKHGGTATIAQIVAGYLGKKVWERSEYLRVLQGIRYIASEENGFIETVERGTVRMTEKGEITLKWMEANNA